MNTSPRLFPAVGKGENRDHRPPFLVYPHQALNGLLTFLRFPTVGSDIRHADDLNACASWLAAYLRRIGLRRAMVVPTAGHPLVIAEWRDAPGAPTLLFYGHYDVQPADQLQEWHTPPFAPTIRGDYLFARGATDDKGQLFAHLKGMEYWLKNAGKLPVNVVCLFEGEEETGSRNLLRFLERNFKRLKADLAVVSDTTMPAADRPAIIHSLRGSLSVLLEVRGQPTDLHSGLFGGMVKNPVNGLCEIIAALHDNEGRITTPGIYEEVNELNHGERLRMRQTGPADVELLANAGATEGWGERGYSLYERTTVRPSLTVTGITGGYQGTGGKGIIPSHASAKIEVRLVPRQEPERVEHLLKDHIRSITPHHLRTQVTPISSSRPVDIDPSHPAFRVVEKACALGFGRRPSYLRSGGSIPVVAALQEICATPVAVLGYGLADSRIHAPNENLYLPNYYRGIATSVHLLREMRGVHPVHGRHHR